MLRSLNDIKMEYSNMISQYEKELAVLKVLDFKKNKDGSYNKSMVLNVDKYDATLIKTNSSYDSKYIVLLNVGYHKEIRFDSIEEFKTKVNNSIEYNTNKINTYKDLIEKLPMVYEKVSSMYDEIDKYVKEEGYHSIYYFNR